MNWMICPLLTIANIGTDLDVCHCYETRCAWFHIVEDPEDGTASGECGVVNIAEALSKKTAPSAANTKGGKVEQIERAVSASNDTTD